MAKHVILESYTFAPLTGTIVITGKNIRREQLLLITNVTRGTVLYNFSDPALGVSSYSNAIDTVTGQETTTLIVSYATSSMSASDKLSILVEETYHEIIPSEVMRDPVDKLRVSEPQALIDTDFEYGTQPTKWETINLLNNRPSAFYDVTRPLTITGITVSTKTITLTGVADTTGIVQGTPLFVQGTLDPVNADGWWIVEGLVTNTSISFTTTNTPSSTLYDATKTYAFGGTFYTGAGLQTSSGSNGTIWLSGTTGVVTTANSHGFRPGDGFYVVGATGNTGLLNSSWVVGTTPTAQTFTFTCAATGTITTTAAASIYPRALGYSQHRAFDGGVQFSNVLPYHGYQVFRQTRRQFRYQSGKGIQFSTGSILKPSLTTDNLTASGTTVTVTTKYPHGLFPNANVVVSGTVETGYAGTWTVATAPTNNTFTYVSNTSPTAAVANGFPIVVSPSTWYGATNRLGMFDSQNGIFFEYDGQTLYCVKRSSTTQIAGGVAVSSNSSIVTGTATKFSTQLKPMDFIVIRGMSYLVQNILSDTSMHIYPEYRGTTATNCVVSKTIDNRYPQSSWNIDKMDGTGASLMTLDLTKMQMFYIDYTWYGAGAIRFGFKNNRGEVIYCHRIPNNNVNTEAYMRSGNLPGRYEINHLPYKTYLTSTLSSAATTGATISVNDTTGWPNTGNVVLTQATFPYGAIEYISYSARTTNTLTIANRAIAGGNTTAQTFTFSNTAPILAELHSPQVAAALNHWGSSVIMDGKFDDDKSFVFNVGMNTVLNNQTSGTRMALMSIRLAPSVDNGLTGLLGSREIINRMQMVMRNCDFYTSGAAFRIELFLNGKPASGTFAAVGGSSLAQVAYHAANTTISGGESIYGFFTSNAGATSQDLNLVRDIGNSILGGGTSLTVPTGANNVFPDGPDIITICATALGGTNSINGRISWTEAQA